MDEKHSEVPTYYSNIVTMVLNTDEMVIEFRSHRQGPNLKLKGEGPVVDVPAATPEEIFSVDPIARVIVTFSSAVAMKEFLDSALPTALANRKK